MNGERPRHLYQLEYLAFLRQVYAKAVLRGVIGFAPSNLLTLIEIVYSSAASLRPRSSDKTEVS